MDIYTALILIIGVTVVILNIMLAIAIFTIRDNSKRQLYELIQQSQDLQQIRAYLYIQTRKEIKDVQVTREKFTSNGVEQEVKVISIDDWIKGYSHGDTHKVEGVK